MLYVDVQIFVGRKMFFDKVKPVDSRPDSSCTRLYLRSTGKSPEDSCGAKKYQEWYVKASIDESRAPSTEFWLNRMLSAEAIEARYCTGTYIPSL
jgi:hypothetical protein